MLYIFYLIQRKLHNSLFFSGESTPDMFGSVALIGSTSILFFFCRSINLLLLGGIGDGREYIMQVRNESIETINVQSQFSSNTGLVRKELHYDGNRFHLISFYFHLLLYTMSFLFIIARFQIFSQVFLFLTVIGILLYGRSMLLELFIPFLSILLVRLPMYFTTNATITILENAFIPYVLCNFLAYRYYLGFHLGFRLLL